MAEDAVSDERYHQLLYRLQRMAKNERVTWLVDGLFQPSRTDKKPSSELLSLIPFGMREFDFVVTCEGNRSDTSELSKYDPKCVPVIPIGLEEAISYFSSFDLDGAVVKEIRQFSAGVIGRMQKFREFVREGVSIEALLDERVPSLERLFEFEWNLIPQTEEMRKALAYIVFSNIPATTDDISHYIKCDPAQTEALLRSCRIISLTNDAQLVSIESRAQRVFVSSRLTEFQSDVRSWVITSLFAEPASKKATMFLPSQLREAGRHSDLLNQLNPKHFLSLLATERSLHSLRIHADLGIESARAISNGTAELSQ